MFIAIRGELIIIIIIIIKPLLMYLTEIAVTQYVQYIPGRRERGRGNGNTASVPIRDAGFAGGKTF
jgi:hypothetical protein